MKKYLNLPLGFNASFQDMFEVANRFESMTKNDQEITVMAFMFWIDNYGNFTEKKDNHSKIVNKMFTRLGSDIVNVIEYLDWSLNNG